MKLRTIIFGATGMVGNGVLLQTLINPEVESVLVIGRRPCGIKHSKLQEIIHSDFYNFSAIEENLKGYNACFFCLGTSSIGMNEKDYTRVTYDLTMQVAKTLSRQNSNMTFCYVSGEGTDSSEKGKQMWARVKGKTENDLCKLPFKAVYLFRPGFIKPVKGQINLKFIFKIVDVLYPVFKTLFPKHGCRLEDVADSMIKTASSGYLKAILDNSDIDLLAGKK